MDTFHVGSAKFFQFECPEELINVALSKAKNCYFSKVIGGSPNSISVGYEKQNDNTFTSFYDENLYKWLTDCANQVSSLYLSKFKVQLADIWAVKSVFGESSRVHTHGMSLFSGLLYLTTCPRSETTFYYRDHFINRWSFFFGDSLNANANIVYKIKPERGKLIIWPSDIDHSASPHVGKDERYTIAFNVFLEGSSEVDTARLTLSVSNPATEKFDFGSKNNHTD